VAAAVHFLEFGRRGAESPWGVTQFGYSHRQKRTLVVDPNGNRTEYRRDHTQRVIEIIQNGKPYLRYKRSIGGTILEERTGDGALLVAHTTTDKGLHASSKLASGECYTYAYDELGNFTEASSSEHRVEQRHVGRVLVEDLRDGRGIRRGFGEAGVDVSVFLENFTVEYESTAGGVRVTTPDGTHHLFWRAADGTLVRENGNGTAEALRFDTRDHLASRICWRGTAGSATTTWALRYLYDEDGLLREQLDSEQGPTRYTYDADHRLVAQEGPGLSKLEYAYDAASNLSSTPTHGLIDRLPDNLLAHSHLERFEFDARQRMAKRVRADGSETIYTYDSADQLVEIRWSGRSETWRAAYDGLGRRIWRECAGNRTDFYWDQDRLAGEVASDGALRMYVYANHETLVPFMWFDYESTDADPAAGVPSYLFCAPTGMPLRIEDASGNVTWQPDGLEPYGNLGTLASPAPVRLRFAGHFHDEYLNLFYNRFRDYDPGLGRYLQPDPLGHAGGLNLYAYCVNPAVDVDLRGLMHKAKNAASGDSNDNDGKKKPSKEALKEGEVGRHGTLLGKDAATPGLDRDPAVKKAMKDAGVDIDSKTTVNNNLTSVGIDKDTHKEGRTHGHKNNEAQVNADAKDLRVAADKDLAEHRKALEGRDPPVPAKDIDAMEAAVHKRNEELGLYDKPLNPDKLKALNTPMKK
jgi:RHS repeat-associated protein